MMRYANTSFLPSPCTEYTLLCFILPLSKASTTEHASVANRCATLQYVVYPVSRILMDQRHPPPPLPDIREHPSSPDFFLIFFFDFPSFIMF